MSCMPTPVVMVIVNEVVDVSTSSIPCDDTLILYPCRGMEGA